MTSEQSYRFNHYRDDHAAFVAEVLNHRAEVEARLCKIGRIANRDRKRLLILQFLSSPSVRLYYLFKSIQAKRLLAQFPPESMRALAPLLSATEFYSEAVYPVNLRSGGKKRTTYNFGPAKHALQRMASDLIRALFPLPSGRHFTIDGGIRNALIAVEGHARAGFKFWIERDIANFYPSVNINELAKLLRPLPGSVTMNVVAYGPGYKGSGHLVSLGAVGDTPLPLRGLLAQGSAASPVAAEVLMANLLTGMPDNVCVVSYADNVLIQGETLDSVEAASRELESRANRHPCGPLGLKDAAGALHIEGDGIHFLGYQGEWENERIVWEPGHHAMEELLHKIENANDEHEVRATMGWLANWQRGYGSWTYGHDEAGKYRAQLGARLAFCAPSTLSQAYMEGLRHVTSYCNAEKKRTGWYPDLSELLPDFQDGGLREGKRPAFIRAVKIRLGIDLSQEETMG